MPEDFGYAWRTVRLYCPSAPTFLARDWVNTAWKQLVGARRWGFMRAEITVPVLDTDTHLTCPADFASLKVVVDQARQVRIPFSYTLAQLAYADPGGTASGQPHALVASTPSTDPLTLGRARYQFYPSGAACTLTAVYHRQGDRLTDTDIFTGVLADGAEVLVTGALAQAALWPGTGDKPNPYFNAGLAQAKANEFRIGIQTLSLRDDEQYPDDLWDSWPEDCSCLGCGADPRTTDASALSY
jgi:hypothetical protein